MRNLGFAHWTARITFLLGLAIEANEFLEELTGFNLLGEHHKDIAKLGVLLFLVSIFSWLEGSNKSLAKLENMSADMKRFMAESDGRDLAARYGAVAASLVKLLHFQDRDESYLSHLRAGGQTLSQLVIETYSEAAKSFYTLRETRNGSLQLQEQSVINMFLFNLAKALPPHSVWLGTSRLQDVRAWNEHSAEVSYHKFEQAIENRVRASNLMCFRLFCYEDTTRLEQMSPVLGRQAQLGIIVRTSLKHPLPPDMTLLWVPKSKPNAAPTHLDPIAYLEQHYEPVCGLKFEIRNEAEVSKMTLSGPNSPDFDQLKLDFARVWSTADHPVQAAA